MQFLTLWDAILTPIYVVILAAIARNIRNKYYPVGHPLRKYYLPALYIKFGGAIFIALVYAFYYKGGDTFNFFQHSKVINSSLNDSFSTWFKLITRSSPDYNPEIYYYVAQLAWYNSPADYATGALGAFLGLFTGTNYLPTALLFAFFSFMGIWAMFRTFYNLYPKAHKYLAYAFLFIPSVFVWGSAIFKDTVVMFGLGWMVYSTFRIFINKDFSIKNILLLVFSFYLISVVKLYILLAFLPALSIWLLMTYSRKIQMAGLRWIVNLLFIGITIAGFIFLTGRFANELNKYSLEKLATTAEVTRGWTAYAAGDEGSVYNIGEFDGTIAGMISKFPQAVVVTFFRPFPWEARKVIVLLSALEALVFLFLTIKIFFNRKSKPLKNLFKDQNILFCFIFAIIFGFAVGVSSGNFGALSRYKIPALPFYGAVLAILYSKQRLAEGASTRPVKSKTPYLVYSK